MGKLADYKKSPKKQTASKSPFTVNGLSEASTYAGDLKLFRQLGLKPFKNISGDHYIGEVKQSNDSHIKIWVHAAPAQFWKFEIYDAESGKKTTASTGSGRLEVFWPTVKMMADNMFVIDQVE